MNTRRHHQSRLIIAGPCSAESRPQILESLREAQQRDVDYVRISLWKPRTKPGFDGLKEEGIGLLAEAAARGVNPATEVLVPQQAEAILDQVLPVLGNGRLMLWIGARNQNHYIQQEIAKVCARDERVTLMVKNQPWPDEKHWEGIAEHVLSSGIKPDNVVLCHRGFTPHGHNPLNLRNLPDHEMAMRIREKTGLKMIIDISHPAGCVENIEPVTLEAMTYDYDGMIIEVHPNPRCAWTDAKQQITWEQFDDLMDQLSHQEREAIRIQA